MNIRKNIFQIGRGGRQLYKFAIFRLQHLSSNKEAFRCPICFYEGPFADINPPTGLRLNAKCPKCGALERHRIQYCVLNKVFEKKDLSKFKMLHFAPEKFFMDYFSERLGTYETADLNMFGVDHLVDLQELPFEDQTYDFIFASHVLEHIADDLKAISEIRRVLKPNGIAILPVPIVANKTVEYPSPNPHESYHVRAPGYDYYDKYKLFFSNIEKYSSESLPQEHQLFICEDRLGWPTDESPYRPAMNGERHVDIVPVCYV